MIEQVIALRFNGGPPVVTPTEYDRLAKEVLTAFAADDVTPGTRLLARLLKDSEARYFEITAAVREAQ